MRASIVRALGGIVNWLNRSTPPVTTPSRDAIKRTLLVRVTRWMARRHWLAAGLEGLILATVIAVIATTPIVALAIFLNRLELLWWLFLFWPVMIGVGSTVGITSQLVTTKAGTRRLLGALGEIFTDRSLKPGLEPVPAPLTNHVVSVLKQPEEFKVTVPTGPPRIPVNTGGGDRNNVMSEEEIEQSSVRGRLEMDIKAMVTFKVRDEEDILRRVLIEHPQFRLLAEKTRKTIVTDPGVNPDLRRFLGSLPQAEQSALVADAEERSCYILREYLLFEADPRSPIKSPEDLLRGAIERAIRQQSGHVDPFELMSYHDQLEIVIQNGTLATSDYLALVFEMIGTEVSDIGPANAETRKAIMQGANAFLFGQATVERQKLLKTGLQELMKIPGFEKLDLAQMLTRLQIDAMQDPHLLSESVNSLSLMGFESALRIAMDTWLKVEALKGNQQKELVRRVVKATGKTIVDEVTKKLGKGG